MCIWIFNKYVHCTCECGNIQHTYVYTCRIVHIYMCIYVCNTNGGHNEPELNELTNSKYGKHMKEGHFLRFDKRAGVNYVLSLCDVHVHTQTHMCSSPYSQCLWIPSRHSHTHNLIHHIHSHEYTQDTFSMFESSQSTLRTNITYTYECTETGRTNTCMYEGKNVCVFDCFYDSQPVRPLPLHKAIKRI